MARKSLVTYYSLTGNTKKIAEAIYQALEEEKTIKPLSEVEDMGEYNLIFIGFPVHSHSVPYKVEKFLKTIPPGKKIALFSTHGSHTGSRLSREALEYAAVLAPKEKVLGTFSCRGRVSEKALDQLKKSPEHRLWTEMAASAHTHPDKDDIADAQGFAKWIMALHSQERE
jgi:flavodoxin